MKKPKLEIDLKPLIDKKIIDARTEKQKQVLQYTIFKNGFLKGFDNKKLQMSSEYINNPAITRPVLTFRYDGAFLFREITTDKEDLHFKYLIEESQTE